MSRRPRRFRLCPIGVAWRRCERREVAKVRSCFFFSSRRRHTRFDCDWSSDVCSSDLAEVPIQRFNVLTIQRVNDMQIKVGIITISDRASKGLYDDLGGPALKKAAEGIGRASGRERV